MENYIGVLLVLIFLYFVYQGASAKEPPKNPHMICPHCQTKGNISTQRETQKVGVSGGKAAAAVLTAGVSVLATGLSRKTEVTRATCGTCGNTWTF